MAGEHKCPLCPATFTRPQHVGRHLRAHTGDRPYECKECPLRFARSDLLSRHVNKAHRTPEPGEPKEKGKKGRRKSLPASAAKRPDMNDGEGGAKATTTTPAQAQAQQPAQQQQQQSPQRTSPEQEQAQATERARRASFDQHQYQQQQPPQLQAQRMYPNHPLLAGTPPPMTWGNASANGLMRSPVNAFNSAMLGTPTSAGFHPGLASPVRWPGADLGIGSSAMMRNESGYASSGYDFGMKKRACDQCNHSKVRCDFAHPCTRCSHRNVHCTYNKPPKSRTLPITPGMSYPMTGMPSGSSLSPVSHFSSPPHSTGSPLVQTSFQLQPTQGQLLSTQSPIRNWSNGLPNQPVQPMTQWPTDTSNGQALPLPLPASDHSGQALGMYMLPQQQQQQQVQQPQETAGASVPITQQYLGQLPNATVANTSPPQALLPTPSLTSHTTSPSSSDEPAERRTSLIGSMTALPPNMVPTKSHSFSSDTPDQLPSKGYTPPAQIDILPAQGILEQQQQQPPQPQQSGMSFYHWPTSAFTVDPRYQFRDPSSAVAQSDDEGEGGTSTANASIYGNNADEPSIVEQRRRSSAGIWASAFNSMSLQDGTGMLSNTAATVPDPYTAVQVAQRVVANQIRPNFPMAPLNESGESGAMPSLSDVKDVWKLFMQDGAGMTPKQEKREGETHVGMAPMVTPRPNLGRSLSKSNSAPDLTSPTLAAGGPLYMANDGADSTDQGRPPAHVQQQQQQHQQGNSAVGDDMSRRNWQTQIQQRQSTFTMQPGGRFGRSGAADTNSTSAMLPPSFSGRPMASIIQQSGALQQTLAPERAPSYGLTPNLEKPNPANITPPQSAGLAGWSRTPSKLAQRSSVTTAVARPGNKRLPSQTLVPEAKKRSASFSIWDDGDGADDGDDGVLGDTEDDTAQMVAYGLPNINHHYAAGAGTGSHSRSFSLGHAGGYNSNQLAQQPLDLSMFISQSTLPASASASTTAAYGGVPPPMAPPGSWSVAAATDNKAL